MVGNQRELQARAVCRSKQDVLYRPGAGIGIYPNIHVASRLLTIFWLTIVSDDFDRRVDTAHRDPRQDTAEILQGLHYQYLFYNS